jgi:hypothetical protein
MSVEIFVQNADFDPPFTVRDGQSEIKVAEGWDPWWVQGSGEPGILVRPEFCQWQGYQKVFSTFATHRGGLYQQVMCEPGDILTLTAHTYFTSEKAGIALVAGLDPYGGIDPLSDSVVWGEWKGETSDPQQPAHEPFNLTVAVEAQGGTVTIFLRSENLWKGKDASAFWDYVVLEAEREGEPVPEPPPNDDLLEVLCAIKDYLAVLTDAVVTIAGQ